MAKYRYTMLVTKVVVYDEVSIEVDAENEVIAKKLARDEAKKMDFSGESYTEKYDSKVYCYSCNPVKE